MKVTCCLMVRRAYAELDYARHFPQSYVDRMKRTVPKRIYDNRFGAPPIIKWELPPDDYVPLMTKRPWDPEVFMKNSQRAREHHQYILASKFFRKRITPFNRIPDAEWTILSGDLVEVMVGPDKGKQGIVSHVIRDSNAVFVDGCHRKLQAKVDEKTAARLDIEAMHHWEEQPLFVDKQQVKLVDPNDRMPCDAKWILNDSRSEYIRVSTRTGFKILLPNRAYVTYEYMSPEHYIEVVGKDTTSKDTLEATYQPKLCTFEQEIEDSLGLERSDEKTKTYWY